MSRLQAGFKTSLGDLRLWVFVVFVFFPIKKLGSDNKKAQWVRVLLPSLMTRVQFPGINAAEGKNWFL